MKRMKRILALVLAVSLCLSLSGCRWLDEAKTSQAKWQGDGTFVLNGIVYKPIAESTYDLNTSGEFETGYITAKDVPVLLSFLAGEEYYSYHDGIIIETYGQDPNVKQSPTDEYYVFYYCHEDYYDSVVDRIQNGFEIDVYAYHYWKEENPSIWSKDYFSSMDEYVLTKEERAAVDQVIAGIEMMEPDEYKDALDINLTIPLRGYSSDRLFYRDICDLVCYKDGYAICFEKESGDEYFYYECPVPEEMNPTFDKIFRAYKENMTIAETEDLNDPASI